MPCYSPLKGYRDEDTGGIVFKADNTKERMEVACGQCLGCRLDRSLHWAMRMVHEAELHQFDGGNSFITLTYRDREVCTDAQLQAGHHIRDDWALDSPSLYEPMSGRSHFQKFMKRLRKRRSGESIKFYMCGEYGAKCKHGISLDDVKCPMCNVGRPHYHAILFNCSFDDLECYAVQDGVERFTSAELQKLWPYGFVDVGEVTVQSAGYVARYITKKVNGDPAEDWYRSVDIHGEITDLPCEYSTMSNGIGAGWYEKYQTDVFPADETPVVGKGVLKGVPRYYLEKLRASEEEVYDGIKAKRLKYRMENAEEFTSDRLVSKYKVRRDQVGTFKRSL